MEKEFAGKRITRVEITGTRSVRRHPTPKELAGRVEGRRVVGVQRRGKYLLLRLEHDDVLVVHLGMSGQLLRADAKAPVAAHTHLVFDFAGAPQLRFVDPRTFGEVFVTAPDDMAAEIPELAHLGFDPIDEPMAWTRFAQLLAARRAKLKTLLTDQRFIAGIGNIYADEILFAAGLRYDRSSAELTPQEVRRLSRSMVEVLHEAIKHRGSSLADEQYRDLYGRLGEYQQSHQVYDREGLACLRCRSTIVRTRSAGRSNFLCAQCQI